MKRENGLIVKFFKRHLYWESNQIPGRFLFRFLRSYLLWNNDWYGSHALRYLPIARLLREIPSHVSFPILEVGSGDRGIAQFIKSRVVTVDLRFDPENMKRAGTTNFPIIGSIENLPFSDCSFDTVIAVDLFEHLSIFQREIATREIFRVARKNVVVAVPCGKKASKSEEILDRFHRKRFGVSNKWLLEHKKNGLPEKDELLKMFDNQKYITKIKVDSNTPLWIWLVLESLEIFISKNYFRRIMTGWFANLSSRWKPLNSYRQIFFIELSKNNRL
jgi:hypothetical protein